MVLMPARRPAAVSRKAEDDKQRKQMKKALSSLELPKTSAASCVRGPRQTREELERDYLYLMRLYENIETLEKKLKAPCVDLQGIEPGDRSIRDYFTTDMDEVLIRRPRGVPRGARILRGSHA